MRYAAMRALGADRASSAPSSRSPSSSTTTARAKGAWSALDGARADRLTRRACRCSPRALDRQGSVSSAAPPSKGSDAPATSRAMRTLETGAGNDESDAVARGMALSRCRSSDATMSRASSDVLSMPASCVAGAGLSHRARSASMTDAAAAPPGPRRVDRAARWSDVLGAIGDARGRCRRWSGR